MLMIDLSGCDVVMYGAAWMTSGAGVDTSLRRLGQRLITCWEALICEVVHLSRAYLPHCWNRPMRWQRQLVPQRLQRQDEL